MSESDKRETDQERREREARERRERERRANADKTWPPANLETKVSRPEGRK